MSISGGTRGPKPIHRASKLPNAKEKLENASTFWVFAMLLLLFDSMISYLTGNLLGIIIPINLFVLILFLIGVIIYGYPEINFPAYVFLGLYGFFLGISVGIISLDEFDIWRLRTVGGAVVAFAVGYACFRATTSTKLFRRSLLLIGGLYALVCFVALIKLLPSIFPVFEAIGNRLGETVIRPEVTTDSNVQIYYLFPAVILLTLRNSNLQFAAIFFITAMSAYALAQLQTRSGSLVLAGTLVLSAIVGMRARGKVDFRFVGFVILGLLLSLVFMDKLLGAFETLTQRFTISDYKTLDHRTDAFTFSILNFFNFDYWLPQGYKVYRADADGKIPHSNITAAYVEGGILGLLGWALLLAAPLVALGRRWLRGVTDEIANIALCGGTVSLIIQLSLNTLLFEQVWLWAGAVVGGLARTDGEKSTREAAPQRGPKPPAGKKPLPGIKPLPGMKPPPGTRPKSPHGGPGPKT